MIPDKIYIEIDNKAHVYFGLQPENAEEYIRKDALLEWVNKMLQDTADRLDFRANQAFAELYSKLNSM